MQLASVSRVPTDSLGPEITATIGVTAAQQPGARRCEEAEVSLMRRGKKGDREQEVMLDDPELLRLSEEDRR